MARRIGILIKHTVGYLISHLASVTSFPFAVSVFSTALAGVTATLFVVYYFRATGLPVSDDFFDFLVYMTVIPWVGLMIQFGLLAKAGILGFGPVAVINELIETGGRVQIRDGLDAANTRRLLSALVRLPAYFAVSATVWVSIVVVVIVAVTAGWQSLDLWGVLNLLQGAAIAVMNLIAFSLVLTEVHVGEMIALCKRRLHELNSRIVHPSSSSVRKKIVLLLILFVVTLYVSNSLTYYNKEDLYSIIVFSFTAVCISVLFAGVIFYTVYRSLRQIEAASYDLKRGGEGQLYIRSIDREFTNVASGMNSASQRLVEYNKSLEQKVADRTAELRSVLSDLSERERLMQKELQLAAGIQQNRKAGSEESWNGFRFSGIVRPMMVVSGDYFDVFQSKRSLYILMADVSGHGVPAALITMVARQCFLEEASKEKSPVEIFRRMNEVVCAQVQTQDYLTAFLLKIDINGKIVYSNAGHPKAMIYRISDEKLSWLDTPGMFVGALEEAIDSYVHGETLLEPGDRLVLYSDGLTEQRNPEGREFDTDGLIRAFHNTKQMSVADSAYGIMNEFDRFCGEAAVTDDVSVAVLEYDLAWTGFVTKVRLAQTATEGRNHAKALDLYREAMQSYEHKPLFLQMANSALAAGETDTAYEYARQYYDNFKDETESVKLMLRVLFRRPSGVHKRRLERMIDTYMDKLRLKTSVADIAPYEDAYSRFTGKAEKRDK